MSEIYDLFIIGGGINGAGIARDASGRGFKVCLAEKGNIGSATSSWSTKLIHGGLRYLENYEFSLVRQSLKEREIIRKIAPSITKPLPFVIPYSDTLRPIWLIKFGLFIYDNLGGKSSIPKSSKISLNEKYPNILKSNYNIGFQYYDLTVDDKLLTELNARDAKKRGANIIENNEVVTVRANKKLWEITLKDNQKIYSKVIVNASGPWINNVIKNVLNNNFKKKIRLVKGSHIITKKLYDQEVAFTLQNFDRRIIFVIPYKNEFSLIGTTEIDTENFENPKINDSEIKYLLNAINQYFKVDVSNKQIVETYSGIRPLIEDFKQASKVSRDYVFDLNLSNNSLPLLNIYGGKLTTYRKLSEKVIDDLQVYLSLNKRNQWTSNEIL